MKIDQGYSLLISAFGVTSKVSLSRCQKYVKFVVLYCGRDSRLVINNCFVPVVFELLLSSYFGLVEAFYLLFASECNWIIPSPAFLKSVSVHRDSNRKRNFTSLKFFNFVFEIDIFTNWIISITRGVEQRST